MTTTPLCSYCQSAISDDDAKTACSDCGAAHHVECWQENGGCSVYGCKQTPPTEARTALEVPVSWWGQENKPCPACGEQILAAALRCRHCGATFASARPEDRAEFRQRAEISGQHSELRTRVIWLFLLSIIPLTAPLGAIMGLAWYLPNRAKIKTLPSVFPALAHLGFFVGVGLSAAFVLVGGIYAVMH